MQTQIERLFNDKTPYLLWNIWNWCLLPQSLDVICSVGTTGEITQVELDLVPALIQSHRHGTDEGLHTGRRLVVRSTETTAHVLVVQYLHFEGEVLFQL